MLNARNANCPTVSPVLLHSSDAHCRHLCICRCTSCSLAWWLLQLGHVSARAKCSRGLTRAQLVHFSHSIFLRALLRFALLHCDPSRFLRCLAATNHRRLCELVKAPSLISDLPLLRVKSGNVRGELQLQCLSEGAPLIHQDLQWALRRRSRGLTSVKSLSNLPSRKPTLIGWGWNDVIVAKKIRISRRHADLAGKKE